MTDKLPNIRFAIHIFSLQVVTLYTFKNALVIMTKIAFNCKICTKRVLYGSQVRVLCSRLPLILFCIQMFFSSMLLAALAVTKFLLKAEVGGEGGMYWFSGYIITYI